ncbi:hypothetical protein COLO4_06344 [Corchorus olitorius]|uniref:Uncharacterized protein n=1 Tax=Corchorus olitorius TaxID=93759 RepID=A0A1R3KNB2_9ROSI|nr:hypothetical protein COLO4_06344 [Corchorus olitorius]
MGSDRNWFIIVVFMVFSSLLSSTLGGSEDSYDREALDALFHYYANQTLAKHHTVSPVVGFNVYASSNLTALSDKKVTLIPTDGSISIHFPYIEAEDKINVTELKCVNFGPNGSVEFKDMTERNVCVTEKAGHFSVVTPSLGVKKERVWKWWVIGFVSAIVGLIVLVSAGIIGVLLVRRMKIKAMEKESDTAEALDTIWVRGDKMPAASMVRTQPVLEHDYVP